MTTTDEAAALLEELSAVHVWPQFVADTYADTLLPRHIARLYAVGATATKAENTILALTAERDRLLAERRDVAEAVAAEQERCAAFIEANVQVHSNDDSQPYYFGPRTGGNTYGLEYAKAIREGNEHKTERCECAFPDDECCPAGILNAQEAERG